MIHFVPAWYNADRPWYSTDSTWFRSTANAEPDDTVTQLRVFQQGSEAAELIVLNYAPGLRRFLHAQDLFDVRYWSFFDEIQGLDDDYTRPLDFLELEWPDDVSFFYNPFLVTAMRGSDVYARVYLAREGTLQSIRFYGDGMPTLERIYDDRGFLSSVLMHGEDGRPMTQYYLSRGGDVILSEDVASGNIDIVQNEGRFLRPSYESWEALMAEFLGSHVGDRRGQQDTVVLALAAQHNDLVMSTLDDQLLIISRPVGGASVPPSDLLERAGAVFTSVGHANDDDGDDASGQWEYLPTLSIYPIERRSAFGASANEAGVYIALLADNLTLEELDYAIAMTAGQLVANEHTRLLVCTFRSQDLEHLSGIRRVIGGYQNLDLAFLADDAVTGLGVDIGIVDRPEEKIQVTFIDRDADLIRTMARSRVLIDLGAGVSPRLAVEAVNLGVPQINRVQHAMVTHPINGYVIGDIAELGTALDHFLAGLEHWNQSLVQCRVLGDLFSAQEVLSRWELIKEGVSYAGAADRA